jgi:hypothetical protein
VPDVAKDMVEWWSFDRNCASTRLIIRQQQPAMAADAFRMKRNIEASGDTANWENILKACHYRTTVV